jgi:pimeloyl-ACP methyl ester carboxylesterase
MTRLTPGDAIANGIPIHYYRSAGLPRRAGPPLMLIHGITDSGLCWPRVVEALGAEYPLVLPDARGHGLSAAPETGYAPADHAADIAGLIGALGLDRSILIGHSMGAMVSATVAARYPDLVRAVVLEDPPWRDMAKLATPEQLAAGRAEFRRRMAENKEKSEAEIIATAKKDSPLWAEEEFADWAVAKRQVSLNAVQYVDNPAPWQETVRAIRCPALLITADPALGAIVTPEATAEAQQLAPQLRAIYIPGAGHSIRREQFAPYLAAVRAFVEQNAG